MKLLVLFLMFIVFVASALALKSEICGLPHSIDGDVERKISCEAYFPSWSYDGANSN
ncbi:male accessory gland serine protease inhibitor isoform X3 [Drosophila biarmipes]|uniref:male accessory gland serine protease inhibitor isoform X3 n=1 Tax=Drosophila biarmipes TaxID=125945 RepID=UPI0021CCE0EF|nr:male accessory gland serine protease inhibitor isoform X3 [Drosophila biarmipes]